MAPLRAASTLMALLLLAAAAAGAHSAPADPAASWVQALQTRASWWALRRWPGGAPQHPHKPLALTLELPNNSLLEVAEDMSAGELLQRLVAAQVGQVGDVEIEVLSVERITRRRPSVLASTLGALAGALRLPAAWRPGGGSAVGDAAAIPAGAAPRLPMAWRLGGGVASTSASAAGQLERRAVPGGDARLAGGAVDGAPAERTLWDAADETDSDSDTDEDEEWQAAGGSGSGDEQRLPITAFDDAYVDEEDEAQVPGRRLLSQRAAKSAAQQHEVDWQASKLFGPRVPALQQLQPVLPAQRSGAAAEAAPARPVVVRVVVLIAPAGQQQPEQALAALAAQLAEQQAQGSRGGRLAGLLDVLAMPAAVAGAARLGRKAAAGHAPASFVQRVAASPGLVVAVNCLFLAACAVSIACMALLARDVWQHGWSLRGSQRGCGEDQSRGEQPQFCSAAMPLVVAADEAAAMAAEQAACAKGKL